MGGCSDVTLRRRVRRWAGWMFVVSLPVWVAALVMDGVGWHLYKQVAYGEVKVRFLVQSDPGSGALSIVEVFDYPEILPGSVSSDPWGVYERLQACPSCCFYQCGVATRHDRLDAEPMADWLDGYLVSPLFERQAHVQLDVLLLVQKVCAVEDADDLRRATMPTFANGEMQRVLRELWSEGLPEELQEAATPMWEEGVSIGMQIDPAGMGNGVYRMPDSDLVSVRRQVATPAAMRADTIRAWLSICGLLGLGALGVWLVCAGVDECVCVRTRSRRARGRCGGCGYDLTGVQVCPECGEGC